MWISLKTGLYNVLLDLLREYMINESSCSLLYPKSLNNEFWDALSVWVSIVQNIKKADAPSSSFSEEFSFSIWPGGGVSSISSAFILRKSQTLNSFTNGRPLRLILNYDARYYPKMHHLSITKSSRNQQPITYFCWWNLKCCFQILCISSASSDVFFRLLAVCGNRCCSLHASLRKRSHLYSSHPVINRIARSYSGRAGIFIYFRQTSRFSTYSNQVQINK